ncbi:prefoldin subunit [Candidatus Micrarchaeota archaeon]|nr:prefoldin subunit [Candidatus Micrarchaeota archaeon]
MAEDVQKIVNEYSTLQQQLQLLLAQRQQFEMQLKEIDAASSELDKSAGAVYRAVGGVMVLREKESVKSDLAKEKQELAGRVEFIDRQEKKMTERFTAARKKLEELAKAQKEGALGG